MGTRLAVTTTTTTRANGSKLVKRSCSATTRSCCRTMMVTMLLLVVFVSKGVSGFGANRAMTMMPSTTITTSRNHGAGGHQEMALALSRSSSSSFCHYESSLSRSSERVPLSSSLSSARGHVWRRETVSFPSWGTATTRSATTALWSSSQEDLEGEAAPEISDPPVNGNRREISYNSLDLSAVATIIVGQSLITLVGVVVALALSKIPLSTVPFVNGGLGAGFSLKSWGSVTLLGTAAALPMGLLAYTLDKVEDRFPALQETSRVTLRNILVFMGRQPLPLSTALAVSSAIALTAGIGEEWVFRGILQNAVLGSFLSTPVSIGLTSIVFGALHAVTPAYAIIATGTSVYFGWLMAGPWGGGNVLLPMVCHTVYDVGALLWAHYTVTSLPMGEQDALLSGEEDE